MKQTVACTYRHWVKMITQQKKVFCFSLCVQIKIMGCSGGVLALFLDEPRLRLIKYISNSWILSPKIWQWVSKHAVGATGSNHETTTGWLHSYTTKLKSGSHEVACRSDGHNLPCEISYAFYFCYQIGQISTIGYTTQKKIIIIKFYILTVHVLMSLWPVLERKETRHRHWTSLAQNLTPFCKR